MKKVEAIIQPYKFEEVKEALFAAGVEGITICVPATALGELAGKQAKLNGLNAVCLNCPPSKEADDDGGELANALVYRIEDADDISSLTEESMCEVTWV